MAAEGFDTIIIGSGISGMTAGIILAREGERVLVLEQHAVPGGLTQTFRRAGTVFPTGVHRLGALRPGQALWHYFQYLGLMDRLELVPMADQGFEAYYFPDCCFTVPQGHDAYRAVLISRFPDQAEAVNRYFGDMASLVSGIALYDPGCTDNPAQGAVTTSLDAYFSKIGIHGQLRSFLSANNPLFGLSSHECPVLTHFMVTDSYLKSSFRINEAATPFSEAMADSLRTAGGTIRTRARVGRFMIKDRMLQGLELAGGEVLKAGRVIYSGHPALLPGLCPPKTFRPVYENRLTSAENTPGLFGVCLTWEKKNCPVADNDAYIYGTWDVNAHYKKEPDNTGTHPDMIFLSALPEDPQSSTGGGTLAVTALAPLSSRDRSQLMDSYNRPGKKAYQEMKTALAEKILDRIEQVFPGAGEAVRVVDTYSPSTFERYTLTPEGSAYGIKKTAQAFLQGMFSPATRVKGLFLTGQSIGFCGIHGGISASVNLCREFFPKSYLMDKIRHQGRAER